MIYTWYWTIVVTIGLVGAWRNLKDRNANMEAAVERGLLDTPEFKAALVFRNTEFFRVSQVIIMLIIGLLALYIDLWPTAWGALWITKNFGTIISLAFCALATVVTINILYFGYMGKRIIKVKHESKN